MAEYEYRPDFCGLCLQDIAPVACLFEDPKLVASIHGYPKTAQGEE